jgi:hypothetical protein
MGIGWLAPSIPRTPFRANDTKPVKEAPMGHDTVRVLRIIEYTGPRDWVERQIELSITGIKKIPADDGRVMIIRAATIGTYPEILGSVSVKKRKRKGA